MAVNEYAAQSNSLMEIIRKNKQCHRINWSYHIYAKNCEIKAEKRIAIWVAHAYGNTIPKVWECHVSLRLPLEWENCRWVGDRLSCKKLTYDSFLNVKEDAINFNGGFLKIHDPGLSTPLKDLGLELEEILPSLHSQSCQPFTYDPATVTDYDRQNSKPDQQEIGAGKDVMPVGRNIHIEATIETNSEQPFQPLFFLPQKSDEQSTDLGHVYLGLIKGEVRQNIYWEISNQTHFLSSPFVLHTSRAKNAENRHTMTVSQDYNWFPEECESASKKPRVYFEFLVDAVGLPPGRVYVYRDLEHNQTAVVSGPDLKADARFRPNQGRQLVETSNISKLDDNLNFLLDKVIDHPFGMGERDFYVGYAEEQPNPIIAKEILVDGDRKPTFYGKLSRLVFDPNASCGSC